jgi:hypothetical protein
VGYASSLPGATDIYGIRYDEHTNIHSWNPLGSSSFDGWVSPIDTKTRATLEDGEDFIVWEKGIRVRQIAHADNYSTVEVTFFEPQQADKVAPTVNLTPLEPGCPATIEVLAHDNIGVTSVSLYAAGTTLRTLTAPPYVFKDVPYCLGQSNSVNVFAKDAAGNIGKGNVYNLGTGIVYNLGG